jgi:hypothetical protein
VSDITHHSPGAQAPGFPERIRYNLSKVASPLSPEIIFVIVVLVAIFAGDLIRRWWRENEWKRRWRRRDDD